MSMTERAAALALHLLGNEGGLTLQLHLLNLNSSLLVRLIRSSAAVSGDRDVQ